MQQRTLVVCHGVKEKKNAEKSPTIVLIQDGDQPPIQYELGDQQAEVDFIKGIHPVAFKAITDINEDISKFPQRQVIWRKLKDAEDTEAHHPSQLLLANKRVIGGGKKSVVVGIAKEVPHQYIGLQEKDTVITIVGGSGGVLTSAIARKLEKLGGKVYRIAPFHLKEYRADKGKQSDATLLLEMFTGTTHRDLFVEFEAYDALTIEINALAQYRLLMMRRRIAVYQTVLQAQHNLLLLKDEDCFPVGMIAEEYKKRTADDSFLLATEMEEVQAKKDLEKIFAKYDVYQRIFEPIDGCGPLIAARIIATVGDIRRFKSAAAFRRYMGVFVDKQGRFPRFRRDSEETGWAPNGRQGLYLFTADQCMKNPDSEWGKKLRETWAKEKELHPHTIVIEDETGQVFDLLPASLVRIGKTDKYSVIEDGKEVKRIKGKQRYYPGHLMKRAIWKTAMKFANHIYREWWKLANERARTGQVAKEKVA